MISRREGPRVERERVIRLRLTDEVTCAAEFSALDPETLRRGVRIASARLRDRWLAASSGGSNPPSVGVVWRDGRYRVDHARTNCRPHVDALPCWTLQVRALDGPQSGWFMPAIPLASGAVEYRQLRVSLDANTGWRFDQWCAAWDAIRASRLADHATSEAATFAREQIAHMAGSGHGTIQEVPIQPDHELHRGPEGV